MILNETKYLQVSTACSLGVFGTQLGTALSFILPPLIVRNHDNIDDIGKDLSYLFYGVGAVITPVVILVFICKVVKIILTK